MMNDLTKDHVELIARRSVSEELGAHREYISNLSKYTAAAAFAVIAILGAALTFWYGNKIDDLEDSMLGDARSLFEAQISESTGQFEEDVRLAIQREIQNLELANLVDREFDAGARAAIVGRIVEDPKYVETFREDFENYLPKGLIAPFDSVSCPDGWSVYEKAFGRVIRGIDISATTDPDGRREPGSFQEDMFKSHTHEIAPPTFVHRNYGGPRQEDMDPGSWGGYMSLTANPTGGAETRSKNVALLYCRKG